MASNIKLKKSSVVGKVPTTGDLEYGEVALNFADGKLYYKTASNTVDFFRSDSASVASGFDSADVIGIVDSAYVNARTDGPTAEQVSSLMDAIDNNIVPALDAIYDLGDSNNRFRDLYLSDSSIIFGQTAFLTAAKINLIPSVQLDSAIIKNIFSAGGDLSYNSGTGEFSFTQTANIDSGAVTDLIDSAYIQARITSNLDEALITSTVDSAYVTSRIDSSALSNLIDTLVATSTTKSFFRYSADSGQTAFSGNDISGDALSYNPNNVSVYVNGLLLADSDDYVATNGTSITLYEGTDLGDDIFIVSQATDLTEITTLIDSAYINARVGTAIDSATTISLINANSLDSAEVISLIDSAYIAARTTAGTDSAAIINLIDSAYVQSRQDFAYSSLTGKPTTFDSNSNAVFSTLTTTGNVVVGGDLQVTGTTTTVSTQNLEVTDNMIYLNAGESAGSPTASIDIGFAGNYNEGGSYAHAGLFRDATDQTWKFFDGYTPEPDSSVQINTGDGSFNLAPLQAGAITGTTLTGIYQGFDSDFTAKSTTDLSEGTNLYYTSARVDSDILALVDSAYVALRAPASGTDSATVLSLISANSLDSAEVISLIDSAYVQARQDFAYSSLTGSPFILDSNNVISLITSNSLDSSEITNLIDSAYVAARTSAGTDSSTVNTLIDAKIEVIDIADIIGATGNSGEYLKSLGNGNAEWSVISSGTDSSTVITLINANSVDSSGVIGIVDSDYITSKINISTTKTLYRFSTDSGQTSFSGNDLSGDTLSYDINNVQVYLNGLLLADSDDYAATDGTTVTLYDGTDSGDDLFVVTYSNLVSHPWKAVSSATYSATAGQRLMVDTTSSAVTVTLPSAAAFGDEIQIVDGGGNAGTNNITISRNGNNIGGSASDLTLNTNDATRTLVYYNASRGWVITAS